MKCPFCNIDITKLENTILDETKYFYITPSLGSLVDGYILIISKRHVNSMSDLNVNEMNEYEELILKYREIFFRIYKKYPIVFEHGTPNIKDNIKASSVIHAHTHIVNHNYSNENDLINDLNFKKISSLKCNNTDKNYIMYISPDNNIYVTNNFKSISQLMRIEIAKDINLLDSYDWKCESFDNNIILTIDKIRKFLENNRENQ